MGGLPFLGRCVNNIARYNSARVVQEVTVTTCEEVTVTEDPNVPLTDFAGFVTQKIDIRSCALEWEPRCSIVTLTIH